MPELQFRPLRLDIVKARSEQEVTVPIEVQLPADVQYLLQPVLEMPPEKQVVEASQGKVRFQAQLQGFIAGVNDDETVVTTVLPSKTVMTSFVLPELSAKTKIKVKPVITATEVDRGENNRADILAYVKVNLQALEEEEVNLLTDAEDIGVKFHTKMLHLQRPAGLAAEELKTVKESVELPQPAEIIMTKEAWITNLGWDVEDGVIQVNGQVWFRVYYEPVGDKALKFAVMQRDFLLSMDLGSAEPTAANVDCALKNLAASIGEDGMTIELTAVLSLEARGYCEESLAIVTGLDGADCLTRHLVVANRIGESEFNLALEGPLQLPQAEGEIEQILGRARLLEATPLEDKVMVRGMLTLQVWYNLQGQQRIMVQEEEFSHVFALEGCTAAYDIQAWVCPAIVQHDAKKYTAPIILRIAVTEQVDFSPVVDVHIVDADAPIQASYIVYRVKKEDTLFGVAKKFNIPRELLLKANDLTSAEPAPGAKLIIPAYRSRYPRV